MQSTGASAIRARDELFREIVVRVDHDLREMLLNYCSKSHEGAKEIDFTDWVAWIYVLWKAGVVDIRDPNILSPEVLTDRFGRFAEDGNGRLTTVTIESPSFRLSRSIGALDKLRELSLCRCQSIPQQLSTLQHLEEIIIQAPCPNLFHEGNFPGDMELKQLRRLSFFDAPVECFTLNFFEWIGIGLPRLEDLRFVRVPMDTDHHIFTSLEASDIEFCETMQELVFDDCKINETHLMTLLLDVLPRFSCMGSLSVSIRANDIDSVQPVVDAIREIDPVDLPVDLPANLRDIKLDLGKNEIERKLRDGNPMERKAVSDLLLNFPSVELQIGYHAENEEIGGNE